MNVALTDKHWVHDARSGLKKAATIIAVVLAIFSWIAPYRYLPWPSFHGQLSAAAATIILAVLVLGNQGKAPHLWPWLACLAAVVSLVPWLQYASGLLAFSGDAWLASLYLMGFALSVFIGRCIGRSPGLDILLERGSLLVLVAALLSMWLALYQWFWLSYLNVFALDLAPPSTRPYANFGQPNNFALALTLGTLATANLYERSLIGGITSLMLSSFFGLGVLMTQSRAALVIWVIVSVLLIYWSARGVLSRVTPSKIALALILASCTYFPWQFLLEFRLGVMGDSDARSLEGMVSSGMRPLHWATIIDAISRAPWFGYGWNQVAAAQYAVAPEHPPTTELLGDSHNLVLDLVVHNGLAIGVSIAVLLGYWLIRNVASTSTPPRVMGICAVLVPTLGSMVEFPLNYTYFLLPTCLIIGALSEGSSWERTISLPRWVAPLLVAATAVLCLVIENEYRRAEEDLRSLRFEEQHVGKPVPRTFASGATVLTHVAAFLKVADILRANKRKSQEELGLIRAVAMRYPNWSLLTFYARELALNGQPSEALAVLTRICRTQQPAYCKLAQTRWELWGKEEHRVSMVPFPPAP